MTPLWPFYLYRVQTLTTLLTPECLFLSPTECLDSAAAFRPYIYQLALIKHTPTPCATRNLVMRLTSIRGALHTTHSLCFVRSHPPPLQAAQLITHAWNIISPTVKLARAVAIAHYLNISAAVSACISCSLPRRRPSAGAINEQHLEERLIKSPTTHSNQLNARGSAQRPLDLLGIQLRTWPMQFWPQIWQKPSVKMNPKLDSTRSAGVKISLEWARVILRWLAVDPVGRV